MGGCSHAKAKEKAIEAVAFGYVWDVFRALSAVLSVNGLSIMRVSDG